MSVPDENPHNPCFFQVTCHSSAPLTIRQQGQQHNTTWRNILPSVWQEGRSFLCTFPGARCEDGSSNGAVPKKEGSEQCYSHSLNPNMNSLQLIPPEGLLQAIAPPDSKQEPGRNLGRINEKWGQNKKCRKQRCHKLILGFLHLLRGSNMLVILFGSRLGSATTKVLN